MYLYIYLSLYHKMDSVSTEAEWNFRKINGIYTEFLFLFNFLFLLLYY